jgi:hypothetical protein
MLRNFHHAVEFTKPAFGAWTLTLPALDAHPKAAAFRNKDRCVPFA